MPGLTFDGYELESPWDVAGPAKPVRNPATCWERVRRDLEARPKLVGQKDGVAPVPAHECEIQYVFPVTITQDVGDYEGEDFREDFDWQLSHRGENTTMIFVVVGLELGLVFIRIST